MCVLQSDMRAERFWNLYSSYIIEHKVKERGKNVATFLFLGEKKIQRFLKQIPKISFKNKSNQIEAANANENAIAIYRQVLQFISELRKIRDSSLRNVIASDLVVKQSSRYQTFKNNILTQQNRTHQKPDLFFNWCSTDTI